MPEALAELPSSAKVTIKAVGSCCTLVAQEILDRKPNLLTAVVARLLKGTILLDTVCFSEQAGRTTPHDVEIVEQCERAERLELFLSLVIARKDVSQLTPSQLLRKDMKVTKLITLDLYFHHVRQSFANVYFRVNSLPRTLPTAVFLHHQVI